MPNFLTGRGRIGRLHYFGISVGLSILSFAILLLLPSEPQTTPQAEPEVSTGALLVILLVGLSSAWVGMAAGVRRLHDIGHSGWLMLIAFIPLVGYGLGLYLLFASGTAGRNRFDVEPNIRFNASAKQVLANQEKLAGLSNETSEDGHDYLNPDGTFNMDGIYDYTTK